RVVRLCLLCALRVAGCLGARSFPTRRSSDLSGPTIAFWCTASLAGPLLIDGLTAIAGPPEILRASTAAGPISLDNYFILGDQARSEEHTSELQSRENLVCRLLLEKKNIQTDA